MESNMSGMGYDHSASLGNKMKKQENHKSYTRDLLPGSDLWTDGLICAFEFVRGQRKTIRLKSVPKIQSAEKIDGEDPERPLSPRCAFTEAQNVNRNNSLDSGSISGFGASGSIPLDDPKVCQDNHSGHFPTMEKIVGSHWIPIGWARISQLVQTVQIDAGWASQQIEFPEDKDDLTVADLAAPYWERPAGPTWWCHVTAGHPAIDAWLRNAQWLHPAISIALRDESQLISDRMKHLLYEIPVRVAGGLLFELLGHSVGDPYVDDIPIVLRSWQAQNFLITALHVKGSASNINVLGITEIQELLSAGGTNTPRTIHEVIAYLASRLSRWDDRLFRKLIFGASDEVELKFMDKRNHEDMNLFSVIMNQEIRRLSRQVIRVKWSLHAREEIVYELLQHLKGNATRSLLEGIKKSTREMIEEQEAVRGRLFTIQDVMQGNVRAWLQMGFLELSIHHTHLLCSLVYLSW
ncbi:PREDICTED: uncharacterized protein LOC104610702 isoform X2 [Nelumbo nucifera]|uniref:Uncharacterized protein LOC104610702 isoform X2 n=1 Tax=Nelumbo nucifera TaxID=4432 RepID=A0A1U8QBR9_NELNU|nr:PREDICTED: uncharacterized protein LOC104610702 isoform X2 [Nelumbo nucifera]